MLARARQTVSIRVPLKATAGLTNGTGKIRIGIMRWTSTADSISADPISAWNAGDEPDADCELGICQYSRRHFRHDELGGLLG